MVEQLVYTEKVGGSNPSPPTRKVFFFILNEILWTASIYVDIIVYSVRALGSHNDTLGGTMAKAPKVIVVEGIVGSDTIPTPSGRDTMEEYAIWNDDLSVVIPSLLLKGLTGTRVRVTVEVVGYSPTLPEPLRDGTRRLPITQGELLGVTRSPINAVKSGGPTLLWTTAAKNDFARKMEEATREQLEENRRRRWPS